MFVLAACTAVANGRLDDLPPEGAGGAGASSASDGEGATAKPTLKAIGTGCDEASPDECASGFCVDGVCCDQKCNGECLACDVFNQNGVCQALVGTVCDGGAGSCTAEGECVRVDDGTCMVPEDCSLSEYCVLDEEQCCNEACDGPCQTCTHEPGDEVPTGICAFDPLDDDACGGQACVGKGLCCGDAVPPTGDGDVSCPAACTGGCNGGTCIIACAADECKGDNITCPVDFDCRIQCIGHHACQDSFIDCPSDHDCTLVCDNPLDKNHACERVAFNCSTGPCSIGCTGDEPCKETEVNCGANTCSVTCSDDGVGSFSVNDDNASCSVTVDANCP